MLGRTMGNLDSQDSPRPRLGGSHHLPPYSILCASPQSPHPNDILSLDSQVRVPKLPKLALLTLGAHNFMCRPQIELNSKAKL